MTSVGVAGGDARLVELLVDLVERCPGGFFSGFGLGDAGQVGRGFWRGGQAGDGLFDFLGVGDVTGVFGAQGFDAFGGEGFERGGGGAGFGLALGVALMAGFGRFQGGEAEPLQQGGLVVGQALFLSAEFGQVGAAGADVELAQAGQGEAGGCGQQAVAATVDGFVADIDPAAVGEAEAKPGGDGVAADAQLAQFAVLLPEGVQVFQRDRGFGQLFLQGNQSGLFGFGPGEGGGRGFLLATEVVELAGEVAPGGLLARQTQDLARGGVAVGRFHCFGLPLLDQGVVGQTRLFGLLKRRSASRDRVFLAGEAVELAAQQFGLRVDLDGALPV